MGETHVLQRMTTIFGGATQSSKEQVDLSELSAVSVHVEIFSIGGSLILEGSLVPEGPWKQIKSWSAEVDESIQLRTYYAAQYPLARFVRWRYSGTAAQSVCFRIRVEK